MKLLVGMGSKKVNVFFFRNHDPGRREHITALIGEEVAHKLCFECPFCGTISILYHSPMDLKAYFAHHSKFRCTKSTKNYSSRPSVSFLFMN